MLEEGNKTSKAQMLAESFCLSGGSMQRLFRESGRCPAAQKRRESEAGLECQFRPRDSCSCGPRNLCDVSCLACAGVEQVSGVSMEVRALAQHGVVLCRDHTRVTRSPGMEGGPERVISPKC